MFPVATSCMDSSLNEQAAGEAVGVATEAAVANELLFIFFFRLFYRF